MDEEYDVKEIEWEHGVIRIHVPKRKATQKEIDEVYRAIAEVKLNTYKNKKKGSSKQ